MSGPVVPLRGRLLWCGDISHLPDCSNGCHLSFSSSSIVHHFAFPHNKTNVLQSTFVNGSLEYSFSQTDFIGKVCSSSVDSD